MSRPREVWADVAKGLAICLVVFGHGWGGLWSSGLISEALFAELDSRIYAFHMPVFFALSGLFFTKSLARSAPLAFLRHRVIRLLWPMVLWTYLFLGTKLLAGSLANTPVTFNDLLILPVPGQLHLWFLWALFLLHMGFLTTRGLLDEDGAYRPAILAGLAALSIVLALFPWPFEISYWIGQALRFMPFFVLGIVLGQVDMLSRLAPWHRVVAGLVFLALLAIWPALPQVRALELAGALVLTATFLILVHGFASRSAPVLGLLVGLGTASMAIYLAHTIFSALTREVLLVIGQRDIALHMVLGFGIGILGPLAVLKAAERMKAKKVLGF